MGGNEVGVVVGGGGVDVVAPRGLEPDDDVAEADRGNREARSGAGAGTILRARAPDRTGTRARTHARIDSHARAPVTGRICAPGRTRARAGLRSRVVPGDGAGLGTRACTGDRTRAFGGARTGVFVNALPRPDVRSRGLARAVPRLGQEVRIALRPTPPLADRRAHRRRQGGEEREVVVEGEPLADLAPRHRRVRRAGRDRGDEGVAALGGPVDPIPRGGHRPQKLDGAGRGVEPHPRCRAARPGSGSSRARCRSAVRRAKCRQDRSTRARGPR